jgi:hypothetical protein
MIFSVQKPQTAFVSSRDFFATEKTTLPGVSVYADEDAARSHSIKRQGMIAGRQWYTVEIPAPDTFLYRAKPAAEQPFPALHRLMSQRSLSLLFAGELTVFLWQLSCYLKDTKPKETEILSAGETAAFYHEKRHILLSLASGEALINFVAGKATRKEPEVLPAFFSALGISGLIDETDGNTVFRVFNPRVSVKILSIHRDSYTCPAISPLRSMQ